MREKTPTTQSYGFLDIWKFLHIYCVDMHALDGQYALKYYGFTKINGQYKQLHAIHIQYRFPTCYTECYFTCHITYKHK